MGLLTLLVITILAPIALMAVAFTVFIVATVVVKIFR